MRPGWICTHWHIASQSSWLTGLVNCGHIAIGVVSKASFDSSVGPESARGARAPHARGKSIGRFRPQQRTHLPVDAGGRAAAGTSRRARAESQPRIEAAGVTEVDRIVERKCVRVGRARGPRDDERIATQEAADDRVVDARTEVDDAEVGEEVAAVPLLGRVLRRRQARCVRSRPPRDLWRSHRVRRDPRRHRTTAAASGDGHARQRTGTGHDTPPLRCDRPRAQARGS